jgi:hypothetical protein
MKPQDFILSPEQETMCGVRLWVCQFATIVTTGHILDYVCRYIELFNRCQVMGILTTINHMVNHPVIVLQLLTILATINLTEFTIA